MHYHAQSPVLFLVVHFRSDSSFSSMGTNSLQDSQNCVNFNNNQRALSKELVTLFGNKIALQWDYAHCKELYTYLRRLKPPYIHIFKEVVTGEMRNNIRYFDMVIFIVLITRVIFIFYFSVLTRVSLNRQLLGTCPQSSIFLCKVVMSLNSVVDSEVFCD